MPLPLEADPQDVALAADGDIEVGPDGLRLISGLEAIAQAVRIRLLMFRGEWFLNQDIGVPYFEDLLGDESKRAGVEARAHAAFTAAILDTPGIVEIQQLSVSLNGSTRIMSVTWAARTLFGDTVPTTVEV